MEDRTNPWSISIGHLIDPDPQFGFTGEASQKAGGAYSHELCLWWDAVWPEHYFQHCKLPSNHPQFLYINILEFVVVILSVAAATMWLKDGSKSLVFHRDLQILAIPVCQLSTDNDTVRSWVHKVCARPTPGPDLCRDAAKIRMQFSNQPPCYQPGYGYA
jgi:hypothetical protein